MVVLVGGVGELFQGDLDLGRRAAERLAAEPLGAGVLVEELHYGAVAIAQRLGELSPEALVLLGAVPRGRPAGAVHRRRVSPADLDPTNVPGAIADAVVGYVGIDLLLDVAAGLGCLPARTVVFEAEPGSVGPSDRLSRAGQGALARLVDLARQEVSRLPVLSLADQVRARMAANPWEPSPAVDALSRLLAALDTVDREGRWSDAFVAVDRLAWSVANGQTGEGMDHLDWAQWWTLIEAMRRLEGEQAAAESAAPLP